ncbi:MAG: MOSC domain-containing protein [Gammaproteobacteria bacterium]|nr:MOSC domain-containing protein [Gammaproteobacteria bacterium]
MHKTIRELTDTLAQRGVVEWIGVRLARRAPMQPVREALLSTRDGLVGDRYAGHSGTRQVTLIQAEHLLAIARFLGRDSALQPEVLRRNLVVAGINLLSLKGRMIAVGDSRLEVTGLCHPCSRMEEALGPGGYNAVRGHGGLTARVLQTGRIALGDPVYLDDDPTPRTSDGPHATAQA